MSTGFWLTGNIYVLYGRGNPLQKDCKKYKELVVIGHAGDVIFLSGEKAMKCEKCGAIKTRLLYNKRGLSLGDD